MAVDPLNPSIPVSASQTEVAAEFRAIKGRLVADKANIETLQNQILPLNNAGAKGLELLAAGTVEAVHEALEYSEDVQAVVNSSDTAAILAVLGLSNITPVITTELGDRRAIEFPGGFKINTTIVEISDNSVPVTYTFLKPFTTMIWAFAAMPVQNTDHEAAINSYTLTQCEVSKSGDGARVFSIIVVGV